MHSVTVSVSEKLLLKPASLHQNPSKFLLRSMAEWPCSTLTPLLHHINAVKESAQCVCVFFLHVLCYVRLCVSSPLFYVSRRSPAEQKKKLNQISINMFHLYVPTLVSHTQTLNSLCVNLASSGLLSLEADCQHQCVRGESYLGLTSAAPIPRMRTVVFACVCTEQEVCIRAAVTGLPMP